MKRLLIKNVNVVLEDEVLTGGSVLVEDGKIIEVGKYIKTDCDKIIDGKNKILMPGFIDVHIHGAVGYDFMDADVMGNIKIAEFKATKGCTSFLATTLTGSKENILKSLQAIADAQEKNYDGAEIIGVHMEGPYFNKDYKGAQNPEFISNPMIDDIKDYMKIKDGLLKLISLAPEKDDAFGAIEFLNKNGVVVSAGHTGATCELINRSVDKGLTHATHTFNGMRPLHHREPGVLGAVMLEDKIYGEVIFDKIHLHPDIVKLLVKVKGVDRLIFITDTMRAVGLSDGEYNLAGLKVNVKDGAARLEAGNLAGSCVTMEQIFNNCIEVLNLELWDIAKIMSKNAADELKIKKGRIEKGYDADLILIDNNNKIDTTIVNGKIVYQK